jgi:hypothetical protein
MLDGRCATSHGAGIDISSPQTEEHPGWQDELARQKNVSRFRQKATAAGISVPRIGNVATLTFVFSDTVAEETAAAFAEHEGRIRERLPSVEVRHTGGTSVPGVFGSERLDSVAMEELALDGAALEHAPLRQAQSFFRWK